MTGISEQMLSLTFFLLLWASTLLESWRPHSFSRGLLMLHGTGRISRVSVQMIAQQATADLLTCTVAIAYARVVQTVGPGPKFGPLTDFFWAL